MKNRKAFWLVAVALVVAVGAVMFLSQGEVANKDIAGTIAPVEKHREQQIATEDVILGDEDFRFEEQTVYADDLDDAVELDQLATQLADTAEILGQRVDTGDNGTIERIQHEVVAIDRNVGDRRANTRRRTVGRIDRTIDRVGRFVNQLRPESGGIGGRRPSDEGNPDSGEGAKPGVRRGILRSFSETDLANIEAELASVRRDFDQNRGILESNAEFLESDIELLESFQGRLQSIVKELNSRLVESRFDDFEAELNSMNKVLENRERALGSDWVESRVDALASMDRALASRGDRAMLDSIERSIGQLGSSIDREALYHRAEKELGRVAELLGSRKGGVLEARVADETSMSFSRFSGELADRARALENRALNNMDSRLASRADEARFLGNMRDTLASSRRYFENREAELESRYVESMTRALGDFERTLESRREVVESRLVGSIDRELASIDRVLESRGTLANRGSKPFANFGGYLESMDRTLGDRGILANMKVLESRRGAFGSRVKELGDRAATLNARYGS